MIRFANNRKCSFVVCVFSALGLLLTPQFAYTQTATLTVEVDRPGVKISPTLYGVFFEEVNMAGDGGLYAELVRNRSFEDPDKPDHWTLVTDASAKGEMAIETRRPMNARNPHSLRVAFGSGGEGRVGVANNGYFGIALKKDAVYELSLAARVAEDLLGPLSVTLEDSKGQQVYASAQIDGLTCDWKTFRCSLTSNATDPKARLVIAIAKPGVVWLDMVSLFPKTSWMKRPHGLRPDLAEMLAGLRPSFLRFPGGCWVEGETLQHAMRWKDTIGDLSQRRTQWCLWQYHSTNGLGYHEYLELCESLGAEPLFVVNCGMSHKENVPMDKMAEWVQDALDAIEYANGSADSRWGAMRVKAGHPQPFNLKYLEIGNENGGKAYHERYALFYDAIKAKYPQMHLVADLWEGSSPSNRPVEIVDEHYYSNPGFFIANARKYDGYNRKGPKIYVGEYAVTEGCGQGNLLAAVGEAAFMTGMERNSDIVALASYAPLFANVNHKTWNPDLINFDTSRAYGTPSYYVQKMFSENRGDVVLPTTVSAIQTVEAKEPKPVSIGLSTWGTQAEFRDITASDGERDRLAANLPMGLNGWKSASGHWTADAGTLRQTANDNGCRIVSCEIGKIDRYTLRLKARKLGGNEGFLIMFRVFGDDNWAWWNLGGWSNKKHAVEQSVGGVKTLVGDAVPGVIDTGRWYDIRIVTEGPKVRCYLDNKLIHDVTLAARQSNMEPLYAVASRVSKTDEVILKVVNALPIAQDTQLHLHGVQSVKPEAAIVVLTSGKGTDENTLDEPTKVSPVRQTIVNASLDFRHVFPANSVTILRLKTK